MHVQSKAIHMRFLTLIAIVTATLSFSGCDFANKNTDTPAETPEDSTSTDTSGSSGETKPETTTSEPAPSGDQAQQTQPQRPRTIFDQVQISNFRFLDEPNAESQTRRAEFVITNKTNLTIKSISVIWTTWSDAGMVTWSNDEYTFSSENGIAPGTQFKATLRLPNLSRLPLMPANAARSIVPSRVVGTDGKVLFNYGSLKDREKGLLLRLGQVRG